MTYAFIGLSVAIGWCAIDAFQTLLRLAELEELRREAHE